jgi:putative chitinase
VLTTAILDRIWPRAPHSLVDGIVAAAPTVLPKYEITTPIVLMHALAQWSVECMAGTQMEENLHYSAERAHEVWPTRFPTVAAATPYAHSPRLLADKVYGGRMGNRAGTDDGWNFRGRGLGDLTGADEYERIGKACGLDLKANPDFVSAPSTCLEVACCYFRLSGAVEFAAKDEVQQVTERVNGGLIGLADRKAWLRRLKHEFSVK